MTKEKFADKFLRAIDALVEHTKTLCFNDFSVQYQFKIRPSVTAVSHSDDNERTHHNKITSCQDRHLTFDEVVELLWVDNKVPLWINMSVTESTKDWTTIELLTSRRFVTEEELNHAVDQYPPFHTHVPLPVDYESGVKFDINWRRRPGINNIIAGWLKKLFSK